MATIFALGSNGSGQLGLGHLEDVSVPKPVLFSDDPPASIKSIVAGGNHTLMLSGAGELFWSGDGKSGACGLASGDHRTPASSFVRMRLEGASAEGMPANSPVGLVAATWETTVFTRQDKQGKNAFVFSCGLGERGELGQGQLLVRLPSPSLIPSFPPPGTEVVDLAACMGHIVAVLSNGDVYGWGNGRKGQLGSPAEIVFTPRKIEGVPFAVKRAVCGKEFTGLVGEPLEGKMLIIGSNKWDIQSIAPQSLPGWQDVGASWSNMFVRGPDKSLSSWGRNDYSQRDCVDGKVVHFTAGSEHVVALLETGDVQAWGWGEHGNCGPVNHTSTSKGVRNVIASSKYIPPGSSISLVAAGCATSWIVIKATDD